MKDGDSFQQARDEMVIQQLTARGIDDINILEAMRLIPRHEFVPNEVRHLAYRDTPLPIGDSQTISQPYIVAHMSAMLNLNGSERVLEVGTGSGYQTAVLCLLAAEVYSVEVNPRLAERAGDVLAELGFDNVEIYVGDGSVGLPDMATFDAIIVTAAAPALPNPLRGQLSESGGRMVLPVGDERRQHLEVIRRSGNRWQIEEADAVRFVPLVGRYGYPSTTTDLM